MTDVGFLIFFGILILLVVIIAVVVVVSTAASAGTLVADIDKGEDEEES